MADCPIATGDSAESVDSKLARLANFSMLSRIRLEFERPFRDHLETVSRSPQEAEFLRPDC